MYRLRPYRANALHNHPSHTNATVISGIILSTFLFIGCSSDTVEVSNSAAPPPAVYTGAFIDSAVANIAYRTESRSGNTNQDGEFTFLGNESVTFSIGNIELPTTKAKRVVTPMDIAGATDINHPMVLNIARLMLSLDIDADPDNGIQISDDAHTQAQAENIAFDSPTFEADTVNLVANSGSVTTTLVDAEAARLHLEKTFKSFPIANAGNPVTVEASVDPVSVQLDGSASVDPDGNPLTYFWTITSQPACTIDGCPTASLDDPTLPNPTLQGMREPGFYVVALTVNDGSFDSINDASVTITLEKPLPASSALLAVALLTAGLFSVFRRKKTNNRVTA